MRRDSSELRDELDIRCHSHQCNYNCECVKYLGVIIDDELKSDHQINNLSSETENK